MLIALRSICSSGVEKKTRSHGEQSFALPNNEIMTLLILPEMRQVNRKRLTASALAGFQRQQEMVRFGSSIASSMAASFSIDRSSVPITTKPLRESSGGDSELKPPV
jgi:hypothetical protein